VEGATINRVVSKPQTPKQLQSFLGMLNYYYYYYHHHRSFIPDFASSEATLRQCVKSGKWTKACEVASYDRLKSELAARWSKRLLQLAEFDFDVKYVLVGEKSVVIITRA